MKGGVAVFAQAIQRGPDRTAIAASQPGDRGIGYQAVNPLPGEIVLIGEFGAVIRDCQFAGDLQPVAIGPILTGWDLHQHLTGDFDGSHLGGSGFQRTKLLHRNRQVGCGVAGIGCVHNCAN